MKEYLKKGYIEPFENMANHDSVEGIIRYALLSKEDFNYNGFHVACHIVTKSFYNKANDFSKKHKHQFDELNIIIPFGTNLKYRFEIDNEFEIVEAPYTVLIPMGKYHSAKPVEGEGIFICIYLNNN